MKPAIIFSCEHAGNKIPENWEHLFHQAQEVLSSHRGFDPGAFELFNLLNEEIPSKSIYSSISRLLVELNRSPHHPDLFSEFTKPLSDIQKKELLADFYYPYRNKLTEIIRKQIRSKGHVLHISVHSFTPQLNSQIRETDIGLLYDPSRFYELNFCSEWKKEIRSGNPSIRVRKNYPYLGKADGMTTFLRRIFSDDEYIGIELEVNQKLLVQKKSPTNIGSSLVQALKSLLRNRFR